MLKVKVKAGDTVRVTTGEHKGAEGKIVRVFKEKNKVIVENVNMVSKHQKPSATNPQGGIKQKEALIQISNLSLIDANGKNTRVGYRVENGKKVRFAKSTNQAI
jgi:large subunit ribosomal protein L24